MRVPEPGPLSRTIIAWSLALTLAGCAGTSEVTHQAAPELSVPRKVTALGVASAKDNSLARRISETRAIKNLARLLEPDALRFELRTAAGDSTLTLQQGPLEATPEATEFIDKIKTSWVAKATATRSDAALAAMEKLEPLSAEVKADYPDPSVALLKAENRAFRRVIAQAAGIGQDEALLTGSLTVLSLDERVQAESAEVKLAAHVEIAERRPLPAADKAALFEEAAREHRSLQEWPRAIAALEHLIDADGATPTRWAEIGELYGYAEKPAQAADAYAQAFKLQPTNLDYLRAEWNAAKSIPDEERVLSLQKKLREAEEAAAKKAAAEAAPPEAKPAPKVDVKNKPSKKRPSKKKPSKKKPSKKKQTKKKPAKKKPG